MEASAVAPAGVYAEGGVLADGVGVVIVEALPGVVVVVEDEVAGEEEDLGPDLAPLAHPLAVKAHGQVGPRGQDGWVELIRAVDDAADNAAVVVVLEGRKKNNFNRYSNRPPEENTKNTRRAHTSSCIIRFHKEILQTEVWS